MTNHDKLSPSDFARARPVTAKAANDDTNSEPRYAVEAVRSAASVYGPATALVKRAGKVRVFESFEAAQAEAELLQQATTADNLTYRPVRFDENGGGKSYGN
jgi:hypothetical protein